MNIVSSVAIGVQLLFEVVQEEELKSSIPIFGASPYISLFQVNNEKCRYDAEEFSGLFSEEERFSFSGDYHEFLAQLEVQERFKDKVLEPVFIQRAGISPTFGTEPMLVPTDNFLVGFLSVDISAIPDGARKFLKKNTQKAKKVVSQVVSRELKLRSMVVAGNMFSWRVLNAETKETVNESETFFVGVGAAGKPPYKEMLQNAFPSDETLRNSLYSEIVR